MSEQPKSYEIPDMDYDALTPEQAQREADRFNSEWGSDLSHPFLDGGSLLHRRFVEHSNSLYGIIASADAAAKEISEAQAVEDYYAGINAKSEMFREEAEDEMAKLVELGFDDDELPENVEAYHVAALKLQRVGEGEKDFEAWTPMAQKELHDLKVDPGLQSLFDGFSRAMDKMDEGLRDNIVSQVNHWIYEANKQKAEALKPKAAPESDELED